MLKTKLRLYWTVINAWLLMLSYRCGWFHFQNTHFFESLCSFPCNKQHMSHFDNENDIEGYKNYGQKCFYIYFFIVWLFIFIWLKVDTIWNSSLWPPVEGIETRQWRLTSCRKHLMWLLMQLAIVNFKSLISLDFLVYISCTWRVNYH